MGYGDVMGGEKVTLLRQYRQNVNTRELYRWLEKELEPGGTPWAECTRRRARPASGAAENSTQSCYAQDGRSVICCHNDARELCGMLVVFGIVWVTKTGRVGAGGTGVYLSSSRP